MRTPLSAFLVLVWSLPATALAQGYEDRAPEERAVLEATIGLGVADRSSTGVGAPLLGMGYDQSFGPLGTLDLRLFVANGGSSYIRHGPVVRAGYHAGPSMGTFTGSAFRFGAVDVGYAGRAEFPCMRRGDTSVHLGGYVGITGAWSDADRGDAYRPNTETQTLDAARTLDHAGLGGTLGLSLDVHFGAFVLGAGFDIHQWFGIDTPVARDLMLAGQLRLGADLWL
jgi:hypothetical protein